MNRFLVVLALAACGSGARDLPLTGSDAFAVQSCPAQLPAGEPLSATGATVTGDSVTFTVSHGGGCKTHTYGLCWTGALLESQPPQADLKILHDDGGGDPCKALITKEMTFDLTNLKRGLQQSYGMQSGPVILHLPSAEPNPRYDF